VLSFSTISVLMGNFLMSVACQAMMSCGAVVADSGDGQNGHDQQ
jgi:hypothetical protein